MASYRDFCARTVFARHENRLFYPVVFCDGPKSTPAGELYYTVIFNDGWYKDVLAYEVVGQELAVLGGRTHLFLGQRVLVDYLGQEHRGSVIDQIGENVRVRLDLINQLKVFKIEQLRLSGDVCRPHFGSLDSFQNVTEAKPRTSELVISKGRSQNASPVPTDDTFEIAEDVKDIEAAALVLTSLSLSPALNSKDASAPMFVFPSSTHEDHEMADSQFDEGYSDQLLKPRSRSFDKPKLYKPRKLRTASLDLDNTSSVKKRLERAESWETGQCVSNNKLPQCNKKSKAFQCMWRGCGRVLTSLPGIVQHVKKIHLGPKAEDPVEFYFNDLFLGGDDASISSDNSSISSGIAEDQTTIETDDEGVGSRDGNSSVHVDTVIAETKSDLEIESKSLRMETATARSKYGRVKTISGRIRSARDKLDMRGNDTSKKCRKVYGMDNKQLWCTQCRWKKACARFGK